MKNSESLETIESITSIKEQSHCRLSSNLSVSFGVDSLHERNTHSISSGKDAIGQMAHLEPNEGVPAKCFKKVI